MSMERKERSGCWRCGSHEVSFWQRISTLQGSFNAILCADCLNDWRVFIRDHPQHLESVRLQNEARVLMAMSCGDGKDRKEEVAELINRINEIDKAIFAIAETWTADMIERPAPPPPPPPTEEEMAQLRERRRKRLQAQLEIMDKEEREAAPSKKIG